MTMLALFDRTVYADATYTVNGLIDVGTVRR